MSRGILIGDKHTFNDWGLILTSADIGYPMPKTEYIDIPHGDGSIDLTEALTGEVKYSNREGTFEFDLIADPNERVRVMNEIASYLHGKVHTIVLPDEPDFIYIGRLSINQLKTSYMLNKLVINVVSNPYKLKPEVTVKEVRLVKNLIENGWDDFEPYGSGEILFSQEGIESGWNLQKKDGAEGYLDGNQLIKDNDEGILGVYYNRTPVNEPQFLTLSIKSNSKSKMTVRYGATSLVNENTQVLIDDETSHTYSFELNDLGNSNLIIEFDKKGVYEITNINISSIDDRHLVVEKTPLGNGLTRIQTWGGKTYTKLLINVGGPLEHYTTTSFYIENLGTDFNIRQNQGLLTKEISSEEKLFFTINSNPEDKERYNQIQFITKDIKDSLDFIASDPIIYEGAYGGELPLPTDEVGGVGTGVAKVILKNEIKKVIPKVTTDKEITLKYGEVEININAGTHLIPQLELQSGDNVIYIRGEVGTNVRFEYQEEGL